MQFVLPLQLGRHRHHLQKVQQQQQLQQQVQYHTHLLISELIRLLPLLLSLPTVHEYNAAIRLGLFKLNKLHETIDFYEQGNFADFVDTYYGARKLAKSQNDVCNEMFYKLILNSCYGKFAQNPDRYEENCICISGWDNRPDGLACECITDNCKCGGWRIKEISTLFEDDSKNYWVWRRNSDNVYRFNVATGASITGASRAILMEAIQCAVRPIYCDTDCVICESLPLKIDGSNLGDWKLEGQGNRIAVAGKKLYTLLDNDKKRCRERLAENKKIELVGGYQCVKKANKGVQITSQDIVSVAMGETIESIKLAPTFSISGSHKFMRRNVHAT